VLIKDASGATPYYGLFKSTGIGEKRGKNPAKGAAQATVTQGDVNRLRDINALFGQPIGDRSLQDLARLIGRHFRAEDHLIRWGGDEFLVVAPGMDESSARMRVAALREELRQPARELPPMSIAVGVAPLAAGGDAAAALEEADRRMLADKPRGGGG
jgi:diguanylate cyclase (GGDEF)-like protein